MLRLYSLARVCIFLIFMYHVIKWMFLVFPLRFFTFALSSIGVCSGCKEPIYDSRQLQLVTTVYIKRQNSLLPLNNIAKIFIGPQYNKIESCEII